MDIVFNKEKKKSWGQLAYNTLQYIYKKMIIHNKQNELFKVLKIVLKDNRYISHI